MKQFFHYSRILLIAFITAVFISACGDGAPDPVEKTASSFSHEAQTAWTQLFIEADRYAAGFRPGPAPRALGYLGFAAYEACIPGLPDNNSLAHLYPGLFLPEAEPGEYHWPTVVNASYGYLMPRLMGGVSGDLKTKMVDLEAQFENKFKTETDEATFQRSKRRGLDVARAIWEWSKTDAYGHDAYNDPFSTYDWQAHYNSPGDWQPTFPGPGKPMFPYWGKVRTFAISEVDKLAKPPLPYSESPTSALYSQALEVYAQNTPSQTYEAEWIAEFWSDDLVSLTFSPPTRLAAIAVQVLEAENSDLAVALETYARLGMALNDAGVGCWYSKYHYNVERPVTYIRRLIDPNWNTSLDNPLTGDKGITPSFPAYPSGHSTFGAAGAEALAYMFGYSYSMTDRCHEGRTEFIGTPRAFGSFYEMAQENAWSRVPLGVHYRMDCEEGLRHGTLIARKVNALPWRK